MHQGSAKRIACLVLFCLWAQALLSVCVADLGPSSSVAGSPSESCATSVSYPSEYQYASQLLSDIQGDPTSAGPILYKTMEAAFYAAAAELADVPKLWDQVAEAQMLSIGSCSKVLVSWSAAESAVIIAFASSEADDSALTQPVSSLDPVDYLSDVFGGSPPKANPAALTPFAAVLSDISSTVGILSGGNATGRVLCTGHKGGGAWAQLCGPWAQLNNPGAQIRVITFGAPLVGDQKLDWALEQFVDYSLLWITASDNSSIGSQPTGAKNLTSFALTRVIPENAGQSGSGEAGSIEKTVTLLENILQANSSNIPTVQVAFFSHGYLPSGSSSQFVASRATPGGGLVPMIMTGIGEAVDTVTAAGLTIVHELECLRTGCSTASPTAASPSTDSSNLGPSSPGTHGTQLQTPGGSTDSGSDNSCTLILCKLQYAIADACKAYNDGASLGPGSLTVTANSTSTNVAVAWDADTKVATFAWRGSQETQDWVQDLETTMVNDNSSPFFKDIYAGSLVHDGFLDQFQAVTDSNVGAAENIKTQLEALSGGTSPNRVDCIGHSLGAGDSTLCAVWATQVWPAADVRTVNFGSPKPGNIQFAESVLALVGRIYRAVNSLDEVPALAPFPKYLHADYPIWLNNNQILLDERPAHHVWDLTWDDHGCLNHYKPAVDAGTLAIPDWVKKL